MLRLALPLALLSACATPQALQDYYEDLDEDLDGTIDTLDCLPRVQGTTYRLWYVDSDQDGHGDPTTQVDSCQAPEDGQIWVEAGDDCNDADPEVWAVVEGYPDQDADGFGTGEAPVALCDAELPMAEVSGDCDDVDETVFPGAEAVCGNGQDDDCSGTPDCETPEGELEIEEIAAARWDGVSSESLGGALASAGDVDGDGFTDALFGAPAEDGGAYALFGPFGDEGEVTATADAWLEGLDESAAGSALSGAGMLDADGYEDFAIGAPEAEDGGAAWVVYGPIRALDADDAVTLELGRDVVRLRSDDTGARVGAALLGGLDVRGSDGLGDLVVGAPGWGDEAGAVFVLKGPVSEDTVLDEDGAALQIVGPEGSELGAALARVGDLDGDGRAELALGAPEYAEESYAGRWALGPERGAVYVLLEATSGEAAELAAVTLRGEEETGFGSVLSDAGDMDGDGLGDLLVGAPDYDRRSGAVLLFSGATLTGEDTRLEVEDATARIVGYDDEQACGAALASAGDLDVDGWDDVLIGCPEVDLGTRDNAGLVGLWRGPLEGRWNAENADAVFLGEEELERFGTALAVTPAGEIFLGAPGRGATSLSSPAPGAVYAIFAGW